MAKDKVEKTKKEKSFIRGRAVFFVMSFLLLFSGVLRLLYTYLTSDTFLAEIDFLISAGLYLVSGFLGLLKHRSNGTALRHNLFLAAITTGFGFFTTLKTFGVIMEAEELTQKWWIILISVLFGILVPALQLLSCMMMRNSEFYTASMAKNLLPDLTNDAEQLKLLKKKYQQIKEDERVQDRRGAGIAVQEADLPEKDAAKAALKEAAEELAEIDNQFDLEPEDAYDTVTVRSKQKKLLPGFLYRRIAKYVHQRNLFYILGVLALLILSIMGEILSGIWGYTGSGASSITWACRMGGLLAYKGITGWAKHRFRDPQIAVVTYAIRNGKLPDKKSHELTDLVHRRFRTRGFAGLFVESLDILFNRGFLKHDPDLWKKAKADYFNNLYSFVGYYLAGLTPLIGYCCLSWWMSHDVPMLKGLFDGLSCTVANRKKLFKRAFFVLLSEGVISVLLVVVFFIIVIAVLFIPPIRNFFNLVGIPDDIFFDVTVGLAFFLYKYLGWMFLQARGMVSILSVFVRESTRNPRESKAYYKLIAHFNKVIDDRRAKKNAKAPAV